MNSDGKYDDAPAPELGELQQQHVTLEPLATTVHGTVQTHVLPSRSGASRNYATAAGGAPVILLGRDERRRRAVIIASGGSVYVGERDDCTNGTAAIWPAGVPLEIQHTEQVYVLAVDTDAVVSMISENWAD
jgi:hypothetical protein